MAGPLGRVYGLIFSRLGTRQAGAIPFGGRVPSPQRVGFMNPGEIYRLRIDLWAASKVFEAGHRIRLEISSSNFPRFKRNLDTSENPGLSARMTKASNTIFRDRDQPSAMVLPVMQGQAAH